jgi:threonine/homoserine/homoserine lactone efflux protein
MTAELLLAFALFAVVSSITPGPNNLMLLASGVNFGFRATVPHILGIGAGFAVLLLAVGGGLAALFVRWPWVHAGLQWVGAAYLLWLAWRLARSGAPTEGPAGTAEPLGFWGAAAFQWVNPKAWIMGVTAFTTYVQAPNAGTVAVMAALFALINLPCLSTWALLGSRLRGWMTVGPRQRVFNALMGALLVLSLWPMLRPA